MKRCYFLLILVCWLGSDLCAQKQDEKPNVVFIIADDLNGYKTRDEYPIIQTPFLDSFKNQAINFVNSTCSTPVCVPSRASFLSGIAPEKSGAYHNGSDPWRASDILREVTTLPEHFKANGYTTWGKGKIFHAKMEGDRANVMFDNQYWGGGFGPFGDDAHQECNSPFKSVQPWTNPDSEFPDVVNADDAIAFLEEDHEDPFFLFYGLWRPHTPYTAPKRFFDLYQQENMPIPEGYLKGDLSDVPMMGRLLVDSLNMTRCNETGEIDTTTWKKFLWGYAATTSFADWNMGRVVDALDKSAYADNTIVIVCSDNGYHMGEKLRWQKGTMWDFSAHTPLMIRMPDKSKAISTRTVSLLDLYPTLVEYCSLSEPSHELDGKSMVPLLMNPDANWDRPSFTTYGVNYSSVRGERYHYIRYPNGKQELYDLEYDPFEFENLLFEKTDQYDEIIAELSKQIPEMWRTQLPGRWEDIQNEK
ncbi:sulfatase [Reichenbachiella ulvae]|uniref:Sulfatase n=1 Tax=Reichenbachiella ulvae TaxID=2980104 RepID=A0ABT3CZZ7_9BACT|nr:sulfatase [Reichenbachiella ulvae]MCV9389277.1 sulfatase [Reichenbachiella ulvae]